MTFHFHPGSMQISLVNPAEMRTSTQLSSLGRMKLILITIGIRLNSNAISIFEKSPFGF